jgi:3-phosphoshikimate 1-carboxyvinyltransferase
MSMALLGLRVAGVTILDPGCVAKTYPAYWRDLASLGVALREDTAASA